MKSVMHTKALQIVTKISEIFVKEDPRIASSSLSLTKEIS
jgi:hypothetical protein